MTELTVFQDKPLDEPPNEELERIALKTLCKDCKNFKKVKNYDGLHTYKSRFRCADPPDGHISPLSGLSKDSVLDINPAGYGCPSFVAKKSIMQIINNMKFKLLAITIVGILSVIGLVNVISYIF